MDPYHSIGMGYGRRAFDFDSNSFMLEGSRLWLLYILSRNQSIYWVINNIDHNYDNYSQNYPLSFSSKSLQSKSCCFFFRKNK